MGLTLEQVKNKSTSKLSGLHPVVKQAAEQLIEKTFSLGIPIVITHGLRTIEEQNDLYAQGRTKPGQIVTNAKGGYSNHNFGVAIDFALLLPDGKSVSWDMKYDGNCNGTADWHEVVLVAKSLGFAWGGDWYSFKDYPHFEMTFGLSTADYRSGKKPAQKDIDTILNKLKQEEHKVTERDINKVSPWAKDAWEEAIKNGDFDGTRPGAPLTREEMAIVISRLRKSFLNQ